MRTFLITNDDGIESDGLVRLARAAKEFGDVWVVAPDGERSAASHSLSLKKPIDVYPAAFPVEGVHAFSCSGTPADCVRVGSLNIVPRCPDAVLSGINYGYNAGTDLQYSATAGAALEAAFQGFPAAAFSEDARDCHEVTDAYLNETLRMFLDMSFPGSRFLPGQVLNVNFPGCPLASCRGLLEDRAVSRCSFFKDSYDEIGKLPGSGVRLMVHGTWTGQAEEGTDLRALLDNYVSVGILNNLS